MSLFVSPSDFETVRDAHDLGTLKSRTQSVVTQLRFDGFLYLMVRQPLAACASPRTFILGTFAPEYLTAYATEQWFRVDPGLRHIGRSHVPLIWKQSDYSTPEAAALFAAASAHGAGAGAVFPVMSSTQAVAGMVIARDAEPEAALDDCRLMLPFGHLLSSYVHAAVVRLLKLNTTPDPKELSQRERECLQLAAQGMRDAEIAHALKITTRTVISHLSSARHKLQAENRAQMIARAITHQVIAP